MSEFQSLLESISGAGVSANATSQLPTLLKRESGKEVISNFLLNTTCSCFDTSVLVSSGTRVLVQGHHRSSSSSHDIIVNHDSKNYDIEGMNSSSYVKKLPLPVSCLFNVSKSFIPVTCPSPNVSPKEESSFHNQPASWNHQDSSVHVKISQPTCVAVKKNSPKILSELGRFWNPRGLSLRLSSALSGLKSRSTSSSGEKGRRSNHSMVSDADSETAQVTLWATDMESICHEAENIDEEHSVKTNSGEDCCQTIFSRLGFLFVGVYDGFSGAHASSFLELHLYPSICKEFEKITAGKTLKDCGADHESILAAMTRALSSTEKAFFDHVRKVWSQTPEVLVAGSCLLASVVKGVDVYVMNLGDSRAVVVAGNPEMPIKLAEGKHRRTFLEFRCGDGLHSQGSGLSSHLDSAMAHFLQTSPYSLGSRSQMLSKDHNTKDKQEVERLRRERGEDPRTIVNGRVKGKVIVTRAFGAPYLKKKEWNEKLPGIFRVDYLARGPYLSSAPHLKHYRLSQRDKYLVFSSDGLYQCLSTEDVGAILEWWNHSNCGEMQTKQSLAQVLAEEAIMQAALKSKLSCTELFSISHGEQRRKHHDDISVVVVKLST